MLKGSKLLTIVSDICRKWFFWRDRHFSISDGSSLFDWRIMSWMSVIHIHAIFAQWVEICCHCKRQLWHFLNSQNSTSRSEGRGVEIWLALIGSIFANLSAISGMDRLFYMFIRITGWYNLKVFNEHFYIRRQDLLLANLIEFTLYFRH